MTRIILLNIYVILSVGILFAQTDNVSLSKKSNYHSWGTNWDSEVVMTNSLCTLTVVPKIGGRTMQYNLGAHAPIYVASGEVGETPTTYTIMGGFHQRLSAIELELAASPVAYDGRLYANHHSKYRRYLLRLVTRPGGNYVKLP